MPSRPQLSAGCAGHDARGSAAPATTGMHVPSVAGRAHVTHAPAQATLQHTASTQNPDAHSSLRLQLWPRGSGSTCVAPDAPPAPPLPAMPPDGPP